ncbi:hypothetical protein CPB85DRAFT_95490 [Mucidula mucida]|nr:hypothetical protein CPB85DRAFT_95490 [Mucidula mucida]
MFPTDDVNDFSTNQHVPIQLARYPGLSFDDGNLAILTGHYYFLVHQGLLSRHSPILGSSIEALSSSCSILEGRPVLRLDDVSADQMHFFLCALYDGVSNIPYTKSAFDQIAAVLRLTTRYEVTHIRQDLIDGLLADWPDNLIDWDAREARATVLNSVYRPRETFPHPILVINLCYDISAPQLLPSAFYDLSRSVLSDVVRDAMPECLSEDALMDLLRGREHASRFLSTFIANHLEGRTPAANCIHQNQSLESRKRTCQTAFEAITFEILRDANGVVCQRSSDPLFAMMDSEMMQTTYDSHRPHFRPCEICRSEFSAIVAGARADFWRRLPEWFGIEVSSWS